MPTSIYYHERPDAPLFLINGKQMPFISPTDYIEINGVKRLCVANPARDYNEKSEQLVRSTRNANGQVIAQKINRRINKFDNLKWPYLSRAQVNWLKTEIAKFECKLTYWDDEVEAWITRRYYWGDFSATPIEWEVVRIPRDPFQEGYSDGDFYYKRPIRYKDVQCNLVDMRVLMKGVRYGVRTKIFKRYYT